MLRTLLAAPIVIASVAVCFPLAMLAMIVTLNPSASVWVARELWSPILLWACGAKLVVHGQENVDPARPTIYAANHQSALDIPAHFLAVPVNFRYVAKQQLVWVPMLGWYLWLAGHVLINRSNRSKAIASMNEAARKVRSGVSIFLYPEGTRSEDGRILPFKKGAFALALQARVPICPVTIEGSRHVFPKTGWAMTPGTIHVKIGKPIDTTAFAEGDREGLARVVRDVLIEQSLELGGPGGDRDVVLAGPGASGRGRGGRATAA